MQNPFTTTFSKTPEYTYITTEKVSEMIENFSYEHPSESVYKITGVRGSGKTVILAKVEETLRSEENREKGWIVCDLNPTRDMLGQMAAALHKEGFGKTDTKSISVSASANVFGTGGGIGFATEKDATFFDIGIALEEMLQNVNDKGKRVLIGIDEVSKTKEMIVFASEFGKWIRANLPVCLVCTGLYENIQEVSNVSNLTFFRRATTIQTTPLNKIRMSEMYKKMLLVDTAVAKEMAQVTMGYAYAYQELGVLYFKKKETETLVDLLPELKAELFAYSYEKIWEELTAMDRYFLQLLTDKDEYKREEVLKLMGEKEKNYSVYRDRMIKRGILSKRQGYISLALPYFAEYIKEYGI